MDDRGQALTLEAIIAAMLILSSLVFALQVTAVTPLSASTSSQHIANQQQASANGVLGAAHEAGELKAAVLYWNDTEARYHGSERMTFYTNENPPNAFGAILDRSFAGRGLAVNVAIYPEGDDDPVHMINRGAPSDHAVTASRTVTIYDDDELLDENGDGYKKVRDADTFSDHIPDASGSSTVYNVVRVEVTVWRM